VELATEEVREVLQGTALDGAPVIPVSAQDGRRGSTALRAALTAAVSLPPRDASGAAAAAHRSGVRCARASAWWSPARWCPGRRARGRGALRSARLRRGASTCATCEGARAAGARRGGDRGPRGVAARGEPRGRGGGGGSPRRSGCFAATVVALTRRLRRRGCTLLPGDEARPAGGARSWRWPWGHDARAGRRSSLLEGDALEPGQRRRWRGCAPIGRWRCDRGRAAGAAGAAVAGGRWGAPSGGADGGAAGGGARAAARGGAGAGASGARRATARASRGPWWRWRPLGLQGPRRGRS
jgi:hypothetical protein